jgi:hypothetical protein
MNTPTENYMIQLLMISEHCTDPGEQKLISVLEDMLLKAAKGESLDGQTEGLSLSEIRETVRRDTNLSNNYADMVAYLRLYQGKDLSENSA